jgi:hypothetical protein
MADSFGEKSPGQPSGNIEHAGDPESARGPARQNNGLEGIEQHGNQANNAGD